VRNPPKERLKPRPYSCDSRLTAGRKRRLEKLSLQPDNQIDASDIPELTERFWQHAIRNPFYRPLKLQLTLRLDADVIAWLRDAMLGDLNPKRRKKSGRARPSTARHDAVAQTRRIS
jgi:uncharacterized protein (DUF4415 family)